MLRRCHSLSLNSYQYFFVIFYRAYDEFLDFFKHITLILYIRVSVILATIPFLKINIVPEAFQGPLTKNLARSKFLFIAGSIHKAPPLMVKTMLTSEESKGDMKSGRGKRLDEEGNCRLVGVAKINMTSRMRKEQTKEKNLKE
ncbi:hypothetical protein AHAS_Ahas16G0251300 [Arachis hypogaea]